MILAMVALILIASLVVYHAASGWEWDAQSRNSGRPPPQAYIFFLLIGIGIFFLVRKIRRTVAPLSDIADATYQVADGDYSVRVTNRTGGRDVAGVVDAFNAMASRLETNETQRRQLLSDIAHELRTPLAVVQGTLEGMIDGVYPADAEHLSPLMDQSRTITRLLEDLQTMATAEAGMLALHRTETDLADLVRDVASAFQPMAMARGIRLHTEVAAVPTVNIDPVRIRQVLDNLVSNALRHTAPAGEVALALQARPAEFEIAVRDTGEGMTQQEADRMFERFAKSADSGGSGLGLTIARNLVEAHGGTIDATSAPGKGTVVALRLPREGESGQR